MNKLIKIDNLMYKVDNLKRAQHFYTDILGLKKVWEDRGRRMMGFVLEKSNSEEDMSQNLNR